MGYMIENRIYKFRKTWDMYQTPNLVKYLSEKKLDIKTHILKTCILYM